MVFFGWVFYCQPCLARDAQAVEGGGGGAGGGGRRLVGGQQDHVVLVGADGGAGQALRVDETLVQLEEGGVGRRRDPCHRLPVG